MSLIELKNLNKYVGPENNQQHILKDVSLKIEKGEFISIIGQSGSGKSTLMNLLGCLDIASSGEYFFENNNVHELDEDQLSELRLKSFGFVFQRYNLLNALTASENVALPAIYSNLNAHDRSERARQLLTDLGLEEKCDNKPNEMSGGQQQRVSIARALMNGGEVILADEPTGALDSKSGEMVLNILDDLHKKGHTIILVTHDSEIAQRADRMIEIKDGSILSDRKIRETPIECNEKAYHPETKSGFLTQLFEAMKMSFHSIISNKLRSLLTMLGIIIGISSVSIIIAIGNGVTHKAINDWDELKSPVIYIFPGSDGVNAASSRLNMDDVKAVDNMSEIQHVSPNLQTSGELIYQNKNVTASGMGADAYTLKISNLKVTHGRFLTKKDSDESLQIAVLDVQAAEKLFGKTSNAIGKSILFNKRPLEVVGVVKGRESSSTPQLWLPFSVLQVQMSRSANLDGMIAIIEQNQDPERVFKKVKRELISRHGVEDFWIYSSDEAVKSIKKYMGTLTFFVSAVAFISLLVGGIGVMNIMLVSVTERIKEIGLRMAIGAKQRDVQAQFLIEASVLCLVGGFIGVSLAFIVSIIFNIFSPEYKMIFSWFVALAALIFSSIIGLLFGYIPAKRASKLKPIEALAQE